MAKTNDEIKNAVLAECERLCPKPGDQHPSQNGLIYQRINGHFRIMVGSIDIHLHDGCPVADWISAYRLLGLEARDAVKEAEITFDRIANAALTSRDIEIESAKLLLEAQRARAAKLVRTIESVQIMAWDAFETIEQESIVKGSIGKKGAGKWTPDHEKKHNAVSMKILDARRRFDAQVSEYLTEWKGGQGE